MAAPAPDAPGQPAPLTYILVDGENLDATLGMSVLQRRPQGEDRPRWERLVDFAQRAWGAPVKPLFFINASSGHLPVSFVQALLALGFRPVPLSGPAGVKVVDVGICRTLQAIRPRPANVLLASHDGDFVPDVAALLGPHRRVGVVGFREFVNTGLAELVDRGLELFDLEDDVRAFTYLLPRIRIIDIDSFDPTPLL